MDEIVNWLMLITQLSSDVSAVCPCNSRSPKYVRRISPNHLSFCPTSSNSWIKLIEMHTNWHYLWDGFFCNFQIIIPFAAMCCQFVSRTLLVLQKHPLCTWIEDVSICIYITLQHLAYFYDLVFIGYKICVALLRNTSFYLFYYFSELAWSIKSDIIIVTDYKILPQTDSTNWVINMKPVPVGGKQVQHMKVRRTFHACMEYSIWVCKSKLDYLIIMEILFHSVNPNELIETFETLF